MEEEDLLVGLDKSILAKRHSAQPLNESKTKFIWHWRYSTKIENSCNSMAIAEDEKKEKLSIEQQRKLCNEWQ